MINRWLCLVGVVLLSASALVAGVGIIQPASVASLSARPAQSAPLSPAVTPAASALHSASGVAPEGADLGSHASAANAGAGKVNPANLSAKAVPVADCTAEQPSASPRSYCAASATYCGEYISRVQMGDIDNSSGCDHYADYTALSTTVTWYVPVPITVTNGNGWSSDSCSIWVDWNQDGVFDDSAPEAIGDQLGWDKYHFNIVAPEGALLGTTRMRIRIDWLNPDPDPCGTTDYGEVEDYSLNVVPAYCPARATYCGEYISRVQMGDIDNSSGCDHYADYTNLYTTLVSGASVPITVTNGNGWSSDSCSIWVDWNQDMVFDDDGPEAIGDQLGWDKYNFNISIPDGAPAGMTRMRIRIDWLNPDPDPCGTTDYGEVEDYSLLVLPDYCHASATNCDEHISRVQMGDIDNSSGCSHYADYTALSTDLVPGVAVPITVTNGNGWSSDSCSIWIDWNQDRIFDDFPPEAIGDLPGLGPYTFSIMIPDGAPAGYTRMRIRIDWLNPDPDPCGTTDFGEVEDYTLHIVLGTGACCNIHTGECTDEVPAPDCLAYGADWESHLYEACAALDPPCGNPGCCCDYPEAGDPPRTELAANCYGRFIAGVTGADCVAEAFEVPCGQWLPSNVLYAPTYGMDDQAFRYALGYLLRAQVDYWDATVSTPTLADLEPYAVVFTWVDYPYADRIAMGNVLADYVDIGGRVILGNFCFHAPNSWYWLEGRIMTPEYCPVAAVSNCYGSGTYGADGHKCEHEGVTWYQSSYEDVITAVVPTADTDGTMSGTPSVVWNTNGHAVFYSAGNLGAIPYYTQGDWVQLTANLITCPLPPAYGACCDRDAYADPANPWLGGVCVDNVLATDCQASRNQFWYDQTCATLPQACGNPGACCDDSAGPPGSCQEVLQVLCDSPRFEAAVSCSDLEPPCGTWQPTNVLWLVTFGTDQPACRIELAALLQSQVDYWEASAAGSTPTLDDLRPYTAVFVWIDYAPLNPKALGDVLADYADIGGRVILGQFCLPASDSVVALEGRILTPEYCPVASLASAYGTGSYDDNGVMCEHEGVSTHWCKYLDEVSELSPTATSDGTIAGWPSVCINLNGRQVFYSPGNMGIVPYYTSGDWLKLIANMVTCEIPLGYGACCDRHTYADPNQPWLGGACADNVALPGCLAIGGQGYYQITCDAVPITCGNPGACCDEYSGGCLDNVLDGLCLDTGRQFSAGQSCAGLATVCGDPGCCCDSPEPGALADPHFAFAANCNGRFIPGAYPFCGDINQDGTLDMADYNLFLDAFGTCTGQANFNPLADLDGDGCVSLVDFQMWRNCYKFQGIGCTADAFDPPCGIEVLSIDTSVGTAPPPPTLCGYEMTPFYDPRPHHYQQSTLPTPCDPPGEILFDPYVLHTTVGDGWSFWSHGYTGDIYWTAFEDHMTMTMPPGTVALYFYVQPNHFVDRTFHVLVNGWLQTELVVNGSSSEGAAYVGVCGTPDSPIDTIQVTCEYDDFALGEFGIACTAAPRAHPQPAGVSQAPKSVDRPGAQRAPAKPDNAGPTKLEQVKPIRN